jgi:LPS sulfotransferase NodH
MSAGPVRAYVICTAPRSGSTLLCRMLAATGVAGNPDSYFHQPSLAAWLADLEVTADPAWRGRDALRAAFGAAMQQGRGATGVFGLRLQRHSFAFFSEKLAEMVPETAARAGNDAARMAALFGPVGFIHLRREDKVAQAVSLLKAEQSGLWHVAPDGRELERLAPPRAPHYDAGAIAARRDMLAGYDRDWAAWFTEQGVTPLRLTYEALAADPGGELARVLAHLGLPKDAAEGVTPGVRKLADATSRAWCARFRAEAGPG